MNKIISSQVNLEFQVFPEPTGVINLVNSIHETMSLNVITELTLDSDDTKQSLLQNQLQTTLFLAQQYLNPNNYFISSNLDVFATENSSGLKNTMHKILANYLLDKTLLSKKKPSAFYDHFSSLQTINVDKSYSIGLIPCSSENKINAIQNGPTSEEINFDTAMSFAKDFYTEIPTLLNLLTTADSSEIDGLKEYLIPCCSVIRLLLGQAEFAIRKRYISITSEENMFFKPTPTSGNLSGYQHEEFAFFNQFKESSTNPSQYGKELVSFLNKCKKTKGNLYPFIIKFGIQISTFNLVKGLLLTLTHEKNGFETAENILNQVKKDVLKLVDSLDKQEKLAKYVPHLKNLYSELSLITLTTTNLSLYLGTITGNLTQQFIGPYHVLIPMESTTFFQSPSKEFLYTTNDTRLQAFASFSTFMETNEPKEKDLNQIEKLFLTLPDCDHSSFFKDIVLKYLGIENKELKDIYLVKLRKRLPSLLQNLEKTLEHFDLNTQLKNKPKSVYDSVLFLFKFLIVESNPMAIVSMATLIKNIVDKRLEQAENIDSVNKHFLQIKNLIEDILVDYRSSALFQQSTPTIEDVIDLFFLTDQESDTTSIDAQKPKKKRKKKKKNAIQTELTKSPVEYSNVPNPCSEKLISPSTTIEPKIESIQNNTSAIKNNTHHPESDKKDDIPSTIKITAPETNPASKDKLEKQIVISEQKPNHIFKLHRRTFNIYTKLIEKKDITIKDYNVLLDALKKLSDSDNNSVNDTNEEKVEIVGGAKKPNKTSHHKSDLGVKIRDRDGKLIETLICFKPMTEKHNTIPKYQLVQLRKTFEKIEALGIKIEQISGSDTY
jgi:hypothetical protein